MIRRKQLGSALTSGGWRAAGGGQRSCCTTERCVLTVADRKLTAWLTVSTFEASPLPSQSLSFASAASPWVPGSVVRVRGEPQE